MFELCHVFKGSVSCFYIMNWPCIMVTRQQYMLGFLCVYFLDQPQNFNAINENECVYLILEHFIQICGL
jgi:hypothetical protein